MGLYSLYFWGKMRASLEISENFLEEIVPLRYDKNVMFSQGLKRPTGY